MNHTLCCRSGIPQHLLALTLAFGLLLLPQPYIACAQELEQAVIRVPKADIYCGPNSDYYSTMQLNRGERVEIIEKGIDGWVSIVPPSQSFCWIAGRDCKLLPSGKEIEIVADRTVCWIGSTLKQTEYRWQSELNRGARITILGEAQRRAEDGSSQLWYRIAPPEDELRWIRIEHLGTAEEVAAVVTASAQQPATSSANSSRKNKSSEKSVLAENRGKPDRKISLASAYEPIAAPEPPRTFNPNTNAANMSPIQPASTSFSPGPTAAGYFDQDTSPRNTFARPIQRPRHANMNPANMRPSAMANNALQPTPNWDQFQAFPTSNPNAAMMSQPNAGSRYTSTPAGPVEWFLSDFLHRNDGGQAYGPMLPTPDAQVNQAPTPARNASMSNNPNYRASPYGERTYSPDQPFQSRVSQLPRPRRRSFEPASGNYRDDSSLLAVSPRDPWDEAALQAPNSLGNIANSMTNAATADYRSGSYGQTAVGTGYATITNWHGINTPANTLLTSATSQPTAVNEDAYAAVNISSPELQQIQLSLSSEVAKPIEQWNLATYKATIEQRLQQSNDPLYRGEARLLIDRIDAFIQLKNRSTHTVPAVSNAATTGPLIPSNPETPATWINAAQYDASGWLVPVHATHTGQPEYAITDDRGNTLAYVTAVPGVNLRRYLRQPVGLKGRRGYLADLNANHIVAERVVSLQR
jgi:hypothetical protein